MISKRKIIAIILVAVFFVIAVFGVSLAAWFGNSTKTNEIITGGISAVTENTDFSIELKPEREMRQLVPVFSEDNSTIKIVVANKNCADALKAVSKLKNYDKFSRANSEELTWFFWQSATLKWVAKEDSATAKNLSARLWTEFSCFVYDEHKAQDGSHPGNKYDLSHLFVAVVDIQLVAPTDDDLVGGEYFNVSDNVVVIPFGNNYNMRILVMFDQPITIEDVNAVNSAKNVQFVLRYGLDESK